MACRAELLTALPPLPLQAVTVHQLLFLLAPVNMATSKLLSPKSARNTHITACRHGLSHGQQRQLNGPMQLLAVESAFLRHHLPCCGRPSRHVDSLACTKTRTCLGLTGWLISAISELHQACSWLLSWSSKTSHLPCCIVIATLINVCWS